MKTKTEAAKILLEKGWTFEEVERVLGQKQIVINPAPLRVYPQPIPTYPYPSPWWQQQTWCSAGQDSATISYSIKAGVKEPYTFGLEAADERWRQDNLAAVQAGLD